MLFRTDLAGRFRAFTLMALLASAAALLVGCSEDSGDLTDRAYQPLSPEMLALMQEKGTTQEAPVLIRAYKQEAELQIWKMRADGHYTLLKTYPMCRWSGQLGPKQSEGDRQVPEGFYWITPAQMNPHSNYYLSFNVGYPNAYDRAHGRSGGNIMVHGACSSAGCFSMTDQQIAEIYAIAREAFAGGQRAIEMQSLPFHMTPENMAKYRLDPNIAFWKELKTGSDNFEVTKQEVAVGVCDGRYVFNAEPADGGSFDPTGPCPRLKRDQMVEEEVLAKQKRDDAEIAELVAAGVRPVHTIYADGGQNPRFASMRGDVSRPDALSQGPIDVAIAGKTPTPAQLKAAEARDLAEANAADRKAAALRAERGENSENAGPPQAVADAPPQPANPPAAAPAQSGGSILTRLFSPQQQPQPQPVARAQQAPVNPAPAQPAGAPAAAPTQSDGSILTRLFSPQPQAAPAAAQPPAAQPPAAPQAAGQDSGGNETGFSRFYATTQPQRASGTEPVAAQQPANGTSGTPQPGQASSADSLNGATIVPQGFSTPDH